MKKILATIISAIIASSTANNTINTIDGEFHNTLEARNYCGEDVVLYQFKSYDDSVWWLLTEEQIGEIPQEGKTYTLTYDDKGTTAENKTCDCPAEWECECELYDDDFISITVKEG